MIVLTNIEDCSHGVSQKIIGQSAGFTCLGYDVYIVAYSNNGCILFNCNNHSKESYSCKVNRFNLFKYARQISEKYTFDNIYVRFPHADLSFISLLKHLYKKKSKIIIEVPSFPLEYGNLRIKRNLFYKISDILFSRHIKKYVKKVFYVGMKTNSIFGISASRIPNGYNNYRDFSSNKSINKNEINMICVSHIHQSHGLDRLFFSLAEYIKASKKTLGIHITIVGGGIEKEHIKSLIKELKIEKYVTMYNFLAGEELECLYAKANMGIGPLALYRRNSDDGSPLKTKDYFLRGIPYICSYNEIGIDENLPFIKKFPNNEQIIDFGDIIDFFNSYVDNYQTVSRNMMAYGIKVFKWENILKKVVDCFEDENE